MLRLELLSPTSKVGLLKKIFKKFLVVYLTGLSLSPNPWRFATSDLVVENIFRHLSAIGCAWNGLGSYWRFTSLAGRVHSPVTEYSCTSALEGIGHPLQDGCHMLHACCFTVSPHVYIWTATEILPPAFSSYSPTKFTERRTCMWQERLLLTFACVNVSRLSLFCRNHEC